MKIIKEEIDASRCPFKVRMFDVFILDEDENIINEKYIYYDEYDDYADLYKEVEEEIRRKAFEDEMVGLHKNALGISVLSDGIIRATIHTKYTEVKK